MIRDLKKNLLFFLTLQNSKLSLRHYYSYGTTLHPTTISTPMSPICQCVVICRETFFTRQLQIYCLLQVFYAKNKSDIPDQLPIKKIIGCPRTRRRCTIYMYYRKYKVSFCASFISFIKKSVYLLNVNYVTEM